jgi:hypothetical protein
MIEGLPAPIKGVVVAAHMHSVVRPSGWNLDNLTGRLVELSGHADTAVLTLVAGVLLETQQRGESAAWISAVDSLFYPPDLAAAGIDLSALPVVRVQKGLQAARAADALIRSGGFGAIAVDLGNQASMSLSVQTRLAGLADNGFLSCADPKALQRICDGLSEQKITQFARKWLRRLPHPFLRSDQRLGIRHDLSILQAEFALTQVFDRPLSGRVFFENVIRENLDLGRPDQVQLIFDRKIIKTTPSRFRTRVITHGVIPSILVDYKQSRIKQYFKEGKALRTETVINNTYDFAIGRKVHNLSELRKVGFTANRRLLGVQRISHDCWIGEDNFNRVTRPAKVDDQRVPALRFGEPRVVALLAAILHFRLLPRGFTNADLRDYLAPLLDRPISPGMMSYDLRRLRLHGLIERVPRSRRYLLTEFGAHAATFLSRSHNRLLRPGSALLPTKSSPGHASLTTALAAVDRAVDRIWSKGVDAA